MEHQLDPVTQMQRFVFLSSEGAFRRGETLGQGSYEL